MKVLLLAPEFFTADSGIPRCLRIYLRALAELMQGPVAGLELVTLNDATVNAAELARLAGGVTVGAAACQRSKAAFVRETLRRSRRCDVILCGHVAQLPVAWLARCLRPRLRLLLVAHGIEVWRPFTFWQRRGLLRTERIFCVSDFTRREMLRHLPLPPAPQAILPNALDPELAPVPEEAREISSPPVILAVARLSAADRYKGIDHLIAAMPEVLRLEPAAQLHIAGRGDDLPRLQAIAAKLGLDRSVHFLGYISDAELRAELARCRLFALPSQQEGFGLVYVEAMAHGRPCLAARAGAAPEIVTDATGVLVEYGDLAGIARAAVSALRGPWDEGAIAARAREFSYSQFKSRLASLLTA